MDSTFILIAALILASALFVNRWLRQLSVMPDNLPTSSASSQSAQPVTAAQLPPDVQTSLQDLLARKKKIEAIKLLREHTRWGLKESKDYVGKIERTNRSG